jgi:hypothetical protein
MAILDRIAAARDPSFSSRVAMILMNACAAVTTEDPATANHANRLALALKHIRAEVNSKALAAAVIANNATIQAAIDGTPGSFGASVADSDIESSVTALYDIFANAYAAPA